MMHCILPDTIKKTAPILFTPLESHATYSGDDMYKTSFPYRKCRVKALFFLTGFILGFVPFLLAQELSSDSPVNRGYVESQGIPEKKKGTVIFKEGSPDFSSGDLLGQEEKNLSQLQKQARLYRSQGLEFQRIANMDVAMGLYQKALELDPGYAVVYNDLGIIYEAKGFIERAEESYLKSIKIDPNYLSAYSNLALLYENKRDLNKAAFYWQKRAELGSPGEPWTDKAKQRCEDIILVLGGRAEEFFREQEVIGLLQDVANKKSILSQDNKVLAQEQFEKAKQSYNKEDYATARKEALNAQQLDPASKEIEKFIQKVQIRALSR